MLSALKRSIGPRHPIRLGYHWLRSVFAAICTGFPSRKLTIIGITGTDGKTTTVGMTAHILHKCGLSVGALSTAFFRVQDTIEWNTTEKTSPSPGIIQQFLHRIVRTGCTHAVLEISSHGLVQHRTDWTWPKVAAITNTSMEHLDYHGTMERYRSDKGKLFQKLRGKGTKVLNGNDETYALYTKIPSSQTIVYNADETQRNAADIALWTTDVHADVSETTAQLHIKIAQEQQNFPLVLPLPGLFNIDNAQCAIANALAIGLAPEQAIEALHTFKNAAGRMERVDEGQAYSVFIDFTVTPAAFEQTLRTLRSMIEPGKRIIVMTGSCGDRMPEKRPIIGQMCSDNADVVVITDDEPYTEDPQKIRDEIWAGIDHDQCQAELIADRTEAINFCMQQAQPGDAVLLCGLGSYPSRWFKDGPQPWDEQGTARAAIRAAADG